MSSSELSARPGARVAGPGSGRLEPRAATTGGRRRRRLVGALWLLLARLVLLGALILLWHLAASRQWVDPTVLSSPGAVFSWLRDALGTQELWTNLSATLLATLIAWSLASVIGVTFGISLALLPTFERVINPYLSALNAMPRIALAPLFVMAFGLTINAKIALAFSLVVFIAISAARAGVASVDHDLTRLAEALGASRVQMFVKILLPVAVPSIFGGMRLGLIYALLGTVTAELIGSVDGIGQQLQSAASLFHTEAIYGLLIILAVTAALINGLTERLERRIRHWKPESS